MMLAHLGHKEAAPAMIAAIETVRREGSRTRNVGDQASTQEMGRAIANTMYIQEKGKEPGICP